MTTAGLKPYPALKDSGVAWLGSVPAHWNVTRARYLFREVDHRSQTGEETHLSMSQTLGLVPSAMLEQRTLISESYAGGKLCEPGDLVLNRLKAHLGVFARAKQAGVISADYTVLRRMRSLEVQYFEETLRSPACRSELRFRAKGIVEGFWRLYTNDFYDIRLPEPPPAEQAAIVRFLDYVDRRIRHYIRAKQRLIKLLEEQKQAIIHRAVTRGLDPTVRLKHPGVEWLGNVPEHWEVTRLAGVIADGPKNGISPAIDERGVIESFSISAVREGKVEVRPEDRKYVSGDRTALEGSYRLRRGDVLLVRGNGNIRLVGRAGLVEEDMPERVYPDLLMRVRVTHRCLPQYLVSLLNCRTGRDQIETAARTAVGTFKINNQQVRQLVFALPSVGEQQRILDWLSVESGGITTAARHARKEIDLVREYRTRLIADVATGKLDVRDVAAMLPDEAGEPEPLDDIAAADTDEAAEDVDADAAPEEDEA